MRVGKEEGRECKKSVERIVEERIVFLKFTA